MKKTIILISLLFALSHNSLAKINYEAGFVKETAKDRQARMQWFQEARFGMFIHFGLYAQPAGQWQGKEIKKYAEWIQCHANIPKEEYSQLAKSFNPQNFDAQKWARCAKDAGMKYMVITSKHHEGFCLWDSQLTDFKITNTPFKRDLLKEISQACKKEGIKFCVYYSIIDWHHPSQKPVDGKVGWARWAQLELVDKPAYTKYMYGQLKELIEGYDPEVIWFDGDWVDWWTLEDGVKLYNYLRQLKPSVIVNNRCAKRHSTDPDFGTPENSTPGLILDYDWEACWTINHTWGYKKSDNTWKTPEVLVRKLLDINSKGGNLLLNVGPTEKGIFPQESIDRLQAMGSWLKTYGKAIYATEKSPVGLPNWGRITAKDQNKIYLHIYKWPKNNILELTDVKMDITSASMLKDGTKVSALIKNNSIRFQLPTNYQFNPIAEVIEVEYKGKIDYRDPNAIELAEGDILLKASDAKVDGKGPLKLNSKGVFQQWKNPKNSLRWITEIVIPGDYDIIVNYSTPRGGSQYLINALGRTFQGNLKDTGGLANYANHKIGRISTEEIAKLKLELKCKVKKGRYFMNLKSIILRKVKK